MRVFKAPGQRASLFDHQFFRELISLYLENSFESNQISEKYYIRLKTEIAKSALISKEPYFPDVSSYIKMLELEHTKEYTSKNNRETLLNFAN